MARFKIQANPGDLARVLGKVRGITDAVTGAATVAALNRGAARLKAQATDRIRGEVPGLLKGSISRRLVIRRASGRRPAAHIDIVARGINLARFSARQTARGVSVSVKQGRKVIRSAFIARGRGGVRLVFARVTQGQTKFRGRPLVGRAPIVGLFGPDVIDVMKNHLEAVLADAGGEITADIQRLVRRFFES